MNKKGFTLIEVIVVLTIFGIVGLVSVTTFLTAFRIGQRSTIQNALLDDARYVMNTIAAEIQAGTIDYEEYFNQCVIGGSCPNDAIKTDYSEFGNNHGLYNWQFKYGGQVKAGGPDDGFGNTCQDQFRKYRDYPHVDEDDPLPSPTSTSCITGPLSFSDDVDTGMNPNENNGFFDEPFTSSAVCAGHYQDFFDDYNSDTDSGTGITPGTSQRTCSESGPADEFYTQITNYIFNELYLINEAGDRKTIIGSEYVTDKKDKAVSKVEMVKTIQAEQDGKSYPLTAFTCADGYKCTTNDVEKFFNGISFTESISFPDRVDFYDNDMDEMFDDFVPISPLRLNIKKLNFVISPLEDPRRAFGENDPNIQMQPQVTILMEVEPSTAFKFPFISDNFNLKLQSTVTAGVLKEVPIVSDL